MLPSLFENFRISWLKTLKIHHLCSFKSSLKTRLLVFQFSVKLLLVRLGQNKQDLSSTIGFEMLGRTLDSKGFSLWTLWCSKKKSTSRWKWLCRKTQKSVKKPMTMSLKKLPYKLWKVDKVPVVLCPSEGHWRRGFEPANSIKKRKTLENDFPRITGKVTPGWK